MPQSLSHCRSCQGGHWGRGEDEGRGARKPDRTSSFTVYGYAAAQTMVQVLKQCGDTLTRANVMKQAASLKDLQLPMAIPGVVINTSATDFFPFEQMQMQRFTGERWELFGPVISGEIGSK